MNKQKLTSNTAKKIILISIIFVMMLGISVFAGTAKLNNVKIKKCRRFWLRFLLAHNPNKNTDMPNACDDDFRLFCKVGLVETHRQDLGDNRGITPEPRHRRHSVAFESGQKSSCAEKKRTCASLQTLSRGPHLRSCSCTRLAGKWRTSSSR